MKLSWPHLKIGLCKSFLGHCLWHLTIFYKLICTNDSFLKSNRIASTPLVSMRKLSLLSPPNNSISILNRPDDKMRNKSSDFVARFRPTKECQVSQLCVRVVTWAVDETEIGFRKVNNSITLRKKMTILLSSRSLSG